MPRKPAIPGIDRRQQILEAALEIFAEQGFEAATNKAIAERAGVNQGLIYFYFASKADVYFATSAHYTEVVTVQLDAIFAQEDQASPLENLTHLLKQIMLLLSAPPAAFLLRLMLQTTAGRSPQGELSDQERRQAPDGFVRYLAQSLRKYLTAHMTRGDFRFLNPAQVSYILTRTLIVTTGGMTITGGRGEAGQAQPDLDLLAKTMAELYCYGLVSRAETGS